MTRMLEQTFLFLPGVHEQMERQLWAAGIHTWEDLLETPHVPSVSRERLLFWKGRVRYVQALLAQPGGVTVVVRMLGSRYAWRALDHLRTEPRFLDIETTEYRTDVTVVGVSDGDFYHGLVQGSGLDARRLREVLLGSTCLVTFNGASFDLPILSRVFPGALPDVPHLDLRTICAQAGLRGGLKAIERHLNIQRAAAIRDTDGADAILLWHLHRLGRQDALQDLIEYNAADVLNLAPLLDTVVPALWRHVRYGEPLPFPPTPRLEALGFP